MSESKLSNISAITAIVVSTLGCGITLMPSVFNLLNTPTVLALMTVVGVMTFFSTYFLAYSASVYTDEEDPDEDLSYSELAAKFSSLMKIGVAFAMCFGSLLAVFSFTQTFIKILLSTLLYNESITPFVENNTMLLRILISGVISVIYFFLFQLDNLSSFSPFSNFSLAMAIIFSLSVVFFGLYSPATPDKLVRSTGKINIVDPIGVVIFALHCQFSFLDIFNSMKDNSLPNVKSVVMKASIFATILYTVVGYLGFRAFGTDIKDDSLLFAFSGIATKKADGTIDPSSTALIDSLKSRCGIYLGYYLPRAIHSMFCPVFFVGILFNMFAILPDLQKVLSCGRDNLISKKMVAFFAALFVFVGGIPIVPNLNDLFAISGFLVTNPLSFLFPALFMLYTTTKKKLTMFTARLMTVLSVAVMVGLTLLYLKARFEPYLFESVKEDILTTVEG